MLDGIADPTFLGGENCLNSTCVVYAALVWMRLVIDVFRSAESQKATLRLKRWTGRLIAGAPPPPSQCFYWRCLKSLSMVAFIERMSPVTNIVWRLEISI